MGKLSFYYNDEGDFIKHAANKVYERIRFEDEVVIFCVGSDRWTGDCLGPMVGTLLEESKCKVTVYGTLNNPVHAKNLEEVLKQVEEKHKNAYIIAIDACLGFQDSVGKIQLEDEALKPGAYMDKKLPTVGNLTIVGIVNVNSPFSSTVLQNTKFSVVYNMSLVITKILRSSIAKYNRYKARREKGIRDNNLMASNFSAKSRGTS